MCEIYTKMIELLEIKEVPMLKRTTQLMLLVTILLTLRCGLLHATCADPYDLPDVFCWRPVHATAADVWVS